MEGIVQCMDDDAVKLSALKRDAAGWDITWGSAWVAVRKNGTAVHVIAAYDLDTLRAKVMAATETFRPGGPR
jgi:hypothetical protein